MLANKQESVPLLRRSAVLLHLSGMIYTVDESHIGSTVNVDVPLCGKDGECVPVPATLLQFRHAAIYSLVCSLVLSRAEKKDNNVSRPFALD